MERLRRKGYLKRQKSGGAFEYSPNSTRADVQSALVRDFVRNVLGGSLSPFVAYLAHEAPLKDSEVDELRRLVRELDAQQGEEAK